MAFNDLCDELKNNMPHLTGEQVRILANQCINQMGKMLLNTDPNIYLYEINENAHMILSKVVRVDRSLPTLEDAVRKMQKEVHEFMKVNGRRDILMISAAVSAHMKSDTEFWSFFTHQPTSWN